MRHVGSTFLFAAASFFLAFGQADAQVVKRWVQIPEAAQFSGECSFPCAQSAALAENDIAVSSVGNSDEGTRVNVYTKNTSGNWEELQVLRSPLPCDPSEPTYPCVPSLGGRTRGTHDALFLSASVRTSESEVQPAILLYRKVDGKWHYRQTISWPVGDGEGTYTFAARGPLLAVLSSSSSGTSSSSKVRTFRSLFDYYFPEANWDVPASSVITVGLGTVVVGAPSENENVGAAYVYSRSGGSWNLVQRLAPDQADAENFGRALSVSGRSLAVGQRGAVEVYTQGAEGGWSSTQTMTDPYARFDNDMFGRDYGISLWMHGPWLMIGADAGYPFTDEHPVSFLAHRRLGRFRMAAEFGYSTARSVQFNSQTALTLDVNQRFFDTARAYDLTDFFAADTEE